MSEIKNPDGIGYFVPPSSPFMFEASDKTDLNITHSYVGTDKFSVHRYLETYEKFVAPLKDKAKNVLEIGIFCGYSMLMWHDFFQQAHIYGMDVNEIPSFLKKDRITTYQQNAYDTNLVQKEFIDKNIRFDVMIDDGPHTHEAWMFFIDHYLPLLNEGGVAIIEDFKSFADLAPIYSHAVRSFKGRVYTVSYFTYNNKFDEHMLVFTL